MMGKKHSPLKQALMNKRGGFDITISVGPQTSSDLAPELDEASKAKMEAKEKGSEVEMNVPELAGAEQGDAMPNEEQTYEKVFGESVEAEDGMQDKKSLSLLERAKMAMKQKLKK